MGRPNDVEGQCNARLFIGDDEGDNEATIRCQLAPGHEGLHQERWNRGDEQRVLVEWVADERRPDDEEPIEDEDFPEMPEPTPSEPGT